MLAGGQSPNGTSEACNGKLKEAFPNLQSESPTSCVIRFAELRHEAPEACAGYAFRTCTAGLARWQGWPMPQQLLDLPSFHAKQILGIVQCTQKLRHSKWRVKMLDAHRVDLLKVCAALGPVVLKSLSSHEQLDGAQWEVP